jgi:hypothetical protein
VQGVVPRGKVSEDIRTGVGAPSGLTSPQKFIVEYWDTRHATQAVKHLHNARFEDARVLASFYSDDQYTANETRTFCRAQSGPASFTLGSSAYKIGSLDFRPRDRESAADSRHYGTHVEEDVFGSIPITPTTSSSRASGMTPRSIYSLNNGNPGSFSVSEIRPQTAAADMALSRSPRTTCRIVPARAGVLPCLLSSMRWGASALPTPTLQEARARGHPGSRGQNILCRRRTSSLRRGSGLVSCGTASQGCYAQLTGLDPRTTIMIKDVPVSTKGVRDELD